jgi:hypothetical protein
MPTLRHPDVHAPWSQWSEDQTLHVAVGYSNPFRWRSRRELMNRFRDHMERQANVVLHVGELAYGDRPWEVTSPDRATDIQLRTATTEHFIKENLQNVIIQHFPSSWKYGMACDADFHMITPGWALETIHQLQHYDWLQPFSSYMDVSGNIYGQANMPVRLNTSFCFNYIANNYQVSPQYHNGVIGPDGKIVRKASSDYESSMATIGGPEGEFMRGCGATGGAFAFRRSAFETVGGFLDRCILGHSDWLQMHLLVGVEPPDIHSQKYHPVYKEYVRSWGRKAERLRKNVGYVDAMATHFWHGSKSRRAYSSRDIILAEEQYHPYDDLATDSQGIYQLRPDAVGLRDKIRKYFISRSEDSAELGIGEKILV